MSTKNKHPFKACLIATKPKPDFVTMSFVLQNWNQIRETVTPVQEPDFSVSRWRLPWQYINKSYIESWINREFRIIIIFFPPCEAPFYSVFSRFWYQKLIVLEFDFLSTNMRRRFTIYSAFLDIKNSISWYQEVNSWFQEINFWYQEMNSWY